MEVISRKDAKAQGLTRYFTGRPCKWGHVAERLRSNGTCIGCHKESALKRYWGNPERFREISRKWSINNPEKRRAKDREWREKNRQRVRERGRDWKRRNADSHRASSRKWRLKNPDKARESSRRRYFENHEARKESDRRWKRNNPIKVMAQVENRRARKRNAPGTHTAAHVTAILLRQGRKCVYCKNRLKGREYHVDHIVPLSRGGSNGPENLQMLCPSCNMKKADKAPEHFARTIGLLI